MAEFFIYNNKSSELIEDKLSKAEQNVYREIQKLSQALKKKYIYATIDYLIKHTEYNSRSFISKTLKRLTDKGLLVRELMQSNKSIHKVYQYYVVQDLRLTKLYQDLPEEEKKKYVVSVKADAEPYTALTEEENKLYCYLKFTIGISDLTHKKLHILLDAARANNDIVSGTEINTIILMSKYCMDSKVINKFGYLKKTIQNYSTEPKATYTPQPDTTDTADSDCIRLYNACIAMGIRLSVKQSRAIVGVARRLKIDVSKAIAVINNCTHHRGIKDIFKYVIKSLYNHQKPQPEERKEQSYDIDDLDSLAITYSGKKPLAEAQPEQSYDIDSFDDLAFTLSRNTKKQE